MRHHYVPQFLLQAWAETAPDRKVHVFRIDLKHLPQSRLTPKNTGYEDDLYALTRPVVAGMEKQAVEKHFLRHVDNLAARVRRKLHDHGLKSLTHTERCDWIRFLASLRLRQPSLVLQLKNDAADHLRRSLAEQPEQYDALQQDEMPPTLEDWTEHRFPGLIENFGLSFFHKLVDNPEIGDKNSQAAMVALGLHRFETSFAPCRPPVHFHGRHRP